MFVSVAEGELAGLGIARLIESNGKTALIEYFADPEREQQPRYEVPLSLLRKVTIPRETRIFSPTMGGAFWRVGRCIDGSEEPIQVQFPNREIAFLSSSSVFVRWRRPIEEPAAYLARMVTETPLFASGRARFVRNIVAQRASAMGITAALSSSIELQAHQLEVARRVLHDPNQRYLLADEVGLGKTIEACIIIRQFFIDSPYGASALIVVPPALVEQWNDELRSRFALGDYLKHSLEVIGSNEIADVRSSLSDVGLLVVDEAHHLTTESSDSRLLYETIRQAAAVIPRLLLLSATPVLRNEGAFLKMLHLLDPLTYSLRDLDSFRRRIEGRQHIAEAVAALTPENALVLEPYFEELLNRFEDDPVLEKAIGELRRHLLRFPAPDDETLVGMLSRLRTHISDTYRLDRRILRNRRSKLPYLTPKRRGSKVWSYRDEHRSATAKALDQIRRVLDSQISETDAEDHVSSVCRSLIDRMGEGPDGILSWTDEASNLLDSSSRVALDTVRSLIADEKAFSCREQCLYENLRDLLVREVKVILFCARKSSADALYEFLRVRMPSTIERHGRHGRRGDAGWHRFLQSQSCKVLVCDASAEEGLNLQGGSKIIVHYDLPFAPNRVEQRIGRVDRFGSGSAVESYVVVCDDDPFETEWYRCLSNGFGLFSNSIASLQFLVDDVMRELHERIFAAGADAIDEVIESLAGPTGRIATELKRIAAQDALDSLSEDTELSWDAMTEMDADWPNIRSAFDPWVSHCLNFTSEVIPFDSSLQTGDRVARYRFAADAQRPTLVSATEFASRFAAAMDRNALGFEAKSPLTHPYSSRRKTSLSTEGRRRGVRLLRAGDAFVNGLEDFTRNDDRGRVYAFWRYAPSYEPASESGVDVLFCVHVTVQADTRDAAAMIRQTTAQTVSALPSLRRRSESIFAPLTHTAWIDSGIHPVNPIVIEQWLLEEYSKEKKDDGGSDTNLRTTRWDAVRTHGVPEMDIWGTLPQRAAQMGIRLALQDSATLARIQASYKNASDAWERRVQQLQLRIGKFQGEARISEESAAEWERGISVALMRGVKTPLATIDSIGAIFLSQKPLKVDLSSESNERGI